MMHSASEPKIVTDEGGNSVTIAHQSPVVETEDKSQSLLLTLSQN